MQPLSKDTLTQINTTICGDERSLEVLQNKGIVKTYTKGYRIYPDGDELLGFLYVLSGKVRFFSVSSNAKKSPFLPSLQMNAVSSLQAVFYQTLRLMWCLSLWKILACLSCQIRFLRHSHRVMNLLCVLIYL